MDASTITVRPREPRDDGWVERLLVGRWASVRVVSLGGLFDASRLPGFVAEADGQRVGLVTYVIGDRHCEVVTLDSARAGRGVGSALLEAVKAIAVTARCRRLWLSTTNDNTPALRFYQRRGWDLVALHRNAVAEWRRLKPEMPERGREGIPLAHALELEVLL